MWWKACLVDQVRMTAIKMLHIQHFPDVTLVSKEYQLLGASSLHQYFLLRLLRGPEVNKVDQVRMTAIQCHKF